MASDSVTAHLLLPNGQTVQVAKKLQKLPLWRGSPISDTYGGKAVLDCDGEPLFAELTVLRSLEKEGWSGVWVDSFRRKFRQALPPSQCDLPAGPKALFDRIATFNGTAQGCWDVFVWKPGEFIFAECKRCRRDRIRKSQLRWLEAALACGLTLDDFVIFEWDVA